MCPHQYFPLAFETLHFQTLLYCISKNVLTLYKNTLKNKDILQQSNQCERINSFSLVTLGNTFLFFFFYTLHHVIMNLNWILLHWGLILERRFFLYLCMCLFRTVFINFQDVLYIYTWNTKIFHRLKGCQIGIIVLMHKHWIDLISFVTEIRF